MELWNDYEGKVLDGQFRLERLIGPKGRSAFFETRDGAGRPATARVIESLNDEDEILARWNSVRGINEPSLVKILACNKTVLDGVHLVYAILEATDGALSEVLRERALTSEETRQVAASVVAGLEALHARGLVHEHVDAESVLAQGEAVKLRSDCVREKPEGAQGETLERRDAHDLAMLVGYALTQRRDAAGARLPRPFDELVKNGMSGVWGLQEMGALVRPLASAPAVGPVGRESAAAASGAGVTAVKPASAGTAAVAATPAAAGRAAAMPGVRPVANGAETTSASAVAASLAGAGGAAAATRRPHAEDRIALEPEEGTGRSRRLLWAGVAAVVVLLSLLIWHVTHGAPAASTAAAPVAMTPVPESAAAVATKPSAAAVRGVGAASGAAVATTAGAVPHGAGPVGSQWRVVAFTYNREEAAQRKVTMIAQEHPELKPEVYAPKGRAPYLVALGGWMTAEQAATLRSQARSEGLPRDVYAQNFRSR